MKSLRSWFLLRLILSIAAMLAVLGGCIVDPGAVLTPQGARMVPGLTGIWLQDDGSGKKTKLSITRTGQAYAVMRRTDDAGGELFLGVYFLPVGDPSEHTYLASLPPLAGDPGSPIRWLFVVKVYRRALVVQLAADERFRELAAGLGVALNGDNSLPRTTARADALRLMTRLADEPFDTGLLFRRVSGFSPLPADEASTDKAVALLRAGKAAAAVEMLSFLAARGNADAQLRLGQLVAAGTGTPRDPGAAAWHLLDAHRSGDARAALQLARHLEASNLPKTPVFMTPLYWWATAEFYAGGKDPGLKAESMKAAHRYCRNRPVEGQRSQDELDCAVMALRMNLTLAAVAEEKDRLNTAIAEETLDVARQRAAQRGQ